MCWTMFDCTIDDDVTPADAVVAAAADDDVVDADDDDRSFPCPTMLPTERCNSLSSLVESTTAA